MVDDVAAQIVPYSIGVPGSGVQEALDTFCSDLTDRLGQLPAVLALDPIEQFDCWMSISPAGGAH